MPESRKLQDRQASNVPDAEGDDQDTHDLGPWMETPNSSRVARLRYDYAQQAVQVIWRNGIGNGHVYSGVDYETFRSFARVTSKGRYINNVLNGYGFAQMDADLPSIPSNPKYNVVSRYRA